MKEEKATLGQGIKLLEYVQDQEIPQDVFQQFEESGILSDFLMCDPTRVNRIHLQRLLRIRKVVRCMVHRNDWSLRQLVETPRYNSYGREILHRNFEHRTPGSRTQGPLCVHIIRFNRPLPPREAHSKLKTWKLRAADLVEILSLGLVLTPEFLREAPIVGLGSWAMDNRCDYFPMLTGAGDIKDIDLLSCGHLSESALPRYIRLVAVPI